MLKNLSGGGTSPEQKNHTLGEKLLTLEQAKYIVDFKKNENEYIKRELNKKAEQSEVTQIKEDLGNIAIKSKNLFDKSKATLNKNLISISAYMGTKNGFFVSEYIEIEPNTEYYLSGCNVQDSTNFGIGFYTGNTWETYIDGAGLKCFDVSDKHSFTSPQNAKYIRFTGNMDNIDNIQLEKGAKKTNVYPFGGIYVKKERIEPAVKEILSDYNSREIVNIKLSDSEEEIFLKMKYAYTTKKCDVYWEYGTYEFSDIFELIKTKYGRDTAYELPIGGNCRYYFNGSVLIATQKSTDPNVIFNESLIGSWRESGSYELHDGIFKGIGMTYVIHDEASGSLIPYVRKYHNIRMEYNSNEAISGMCLGGGTGSKGNVEFDGCVFLTNSDSSMDGGYHGKQINIDTESVFRATVKNCYFSKRFQTGELSENETAELIYCCNSHKMKPGGDKWNIIEWNNTTHD